MIRKKNFVKKQPKRFDMYRKPIKARWWLRLVEVIAGPVYLVLNKGKVRTEKAVKQLKGPYLILSSHASFMDFPQLMCGILPRTTGWVMSVEEFRRGDWLMYGIGGMPKRKFTHATVTAKNTETISRPLSRSKIFPCGYQRTVGRCTRQTLQARKSSRGFV